MLTEVRERVTREQLPAAAPRAGRKATALAGVVLAAVVGGTVVASLAVTRFADRAGRRRCYVVMYLLLAVTGAAFAASAPLWVLVAVSLTGAMSTEVVESGPFTSLKQTMLATGLARGRRAAGFGLYNAVATVSGSAGALAAPAPGPAAPRRSPVGRCLPVVYRLSGLFAVDSFGGGFVIQAFVAYWFSARFGTPAALIGVVFFAAGLLQAISFLAAVRLSWRFGLLPVMVFTHLPSNLLLIAVAFAPGFGAAGSWPDDAHICVFTDAEASALIGRPVTGHPTVVVSDGNECQYLSSPAIDSAGNAHYIQVVVTTASSSQYAAQAKTDCAGLAGSPPNPIVKIGNCGYIQLQIPGKGEEISGHFWAGDLGYLLLLSDTSGVVGAEATKKMTDALTLMARRFGVS